MAKRSALTDKGSTSQWRKIRQRILRRDQYVCQLCGAEATTVDHIIPRRLQGGDSPENLQSLCAHCNYSKGGRFFERARTPLTLLGSFCPENESKTHYDA